MPENRPLKIGTEIEIRAKNVEQEFNRIGKLAQEALNFDPQNKSLQEMVSNAEAIYASVNKTTEAMRLQEQLTKAMSDRSTAQDYVDKYAKEKTKLENLIDVRNARGQDITKQRAQLVALQSNLQVAQELLTEYNHVVEDLQSKLSSLQASGADIDKSLTFENARVSASGLLELLQSIDEVSTNAIKQSSKQDLVVSDYKGDTANIDVSLEESITKASELRAEIDQLNQDVSALMSGASGDNLSEQLEDIYTRADTLQEKISELVDTTTELHSTSAGGITNVTGLSDEDVTKFDEAVSTTVTDIQNLGDGLSQVVAQTTPLKTALALDTSVSGLESINKEVLSLASNAETLYKDLFHLNEFKGESTYEEFNRISTSAIALKDHANALVDEFDKIYLQSKQQLPTEEFEKFDEVAGKLSHNFHALSEMLNYLPMVDWSLLDGKSLQEQIDLLEGLKTEFERVYNTFTELKMSPEQMETFEAGAGQEMLNQYENLLSILEALKQSSEQTQSVEVSTDGLPEATEEINRLSTAKTELENTPPIDGDVIISEDAPLNLQEMIDRYNELKRILSDFNAGKITLSDEQFGQYSNDLATLGQQITNYKSLLISASDVARNTAYQSASATNTATEAVQRASSEISKVGSNASRSGATASSAFKSIEKSIRGAFSSISRLVSTIGGKLTSAFHKVQNSAEKALSAKTFKRGLTTILKYGFGVRSLYFAFRKLRTAIKEGLKNLVQYESAMGTSQNVDSVNTAITSLNTSLLYLKNAWAAAISPVITYVMPVLTSLINKFAEVGNAIARFIGALTGQSVVINAVKVDAQDYAESLDNTKDSANGASGAAKKLSDRLASFDDLNVLGKDNDAGGGGGGADLDSYVPDPSEMFQYVEVDSAYAEMVKNFINKLKESWETGDFTWLGETLKEKIIEGLDWLDGHWGEIQSYADRIGHSLGSFLVGFLGDPELWEKAGHNIGEAFNTINMGISAFLDELDKIPFGENAGKGVNEFLQTTDWELAGDNINRAITGVIENIDEFVNTLNATDIVDAITKFTTGLDIPEIVADVGTLTLDVTELVATVVGGIVVNAGDSFGQSLWDAISENGSNGVVTSKDGVEVPIRFSLTEFIGFDEQDAADHPILALLLRAIAQPIEMSAILGITLGATNADTETITKMFDGTMFNNFKETLSDWGDEISETFQPVLDFFNELGESISVTAEAFGMGAEGVGELFVLGSEEIGGGIVTFMVDFVDACEDFGEKWDEFWTSLGDFDFWEWLTDEALKWSDFYEEFKAKGGEIVNGIGDGIAEVFDDVTTWVADNIVDPIVTGFCELFGIHSPSTVAEGWGVDIIQGLLNGINSLIDDVTQIFTDLGGSLSTKWDEFKTTAEEKWGLVKDSITTAFTTAKDDVEKNVALFKDNVAIKWEEFSTDAEDFWGTIRDTITDRIETAKSNAEGTAELFKTTLATKWDEIKTDVEDKFNSAKDKIIEIFEQIQEGVKNPINGFLDIVEKMVNRVIEGINLVADTFNTLPDVTLTNPFTGTEYTLGFNIPHLNYVDIPPLAQGAVIPPNREFMAILGDQSHGTNIEAPLDTIKQAVAEELSAQIDVLTNGFSSVVQAINNKNLTIGDKEIGKANARFTNQQRMIRGTTF